MGRHAIEIDRDQFEKLCAIQCTEEEIASWFKCSHDTIQRWCKRTYKQDFAYIYKRFSSDGKISLRRTQFKLASKNTAMAIFLGKQYLGQSDQIQVDQTTTLKKLDEYLTDIKKDIDEDAIE